MSDPVNLSYQNGNYFEKLTRLWKKIIRFTFFPGRVTFFKSLITRFKEFSTMKFQYIPFRVMLIVLPGLSNSVHFFFMKNFLKTPQIVVIFEN